MELFHHLNFSFSSSLYVAPPMGPVSGCVPPSACVINILLGTPLLSCTLNQSRPTTANLIPANSERKPQAKKLEAFNFTHSYILNYVFAK